MEIILNRVRSLRGSAALKKLCRSMLCWRVQKFGFCHSWCSFRLTYSVSDDCVVAVRWEIVKDKIVFQESKPLGVSMSLKLSSFLQVANICIVSFAKFVYNYYLWMRFNLKWSQLLYQTGPFCPDEISGHAQKSESGSIEKYQKVWLQ